MAIAALSDDAVHLQRSTRGDTTDFSSTTLALSVVAPESTVKSVPRAQRAHRWRVGGGRDAHQG
jgi:hypothetical protein